MTYTETLSWMYAQLPMYQNKGVKAFNSKLDGIKALSQQLGNPHQKFKSIHVAGTNGKGSSSHMLASILQEAGYNVGLYTSPHLKDFRERIRINGEMISQEFVVDFMKSNKVFLEDNMLSFFEMTVGMAFCYFEKQNVDIAIIETGLGGRLDSTNIIIPRVSLITNIGLDHMDILGDTLTEIAYEKAGIIKTQVSVVISESHMDTINVFKKVSKEQNANLIFAEDQHYPDYKTDLLGQYQAKNQKGVLAVINELEEFEVSKEHITKGLLNVVKNTGLRGRWEQLGNSPTIICDTAHNFDGLSIALNQLKQQEFEVLHMVLGFVKEKDLRRILLLFPKEAEFYFCKPKISRGLDAHELMNKANDYGLKGNVYSSVRKAFTAAKTKAKNLDYIYVGGSTFVVSEVL